MRRFRVLITHEVLRSPLPPARERTQIFRFLESLSSDPYQRGDYEERDSVGRPLQIKIVGAHAVTYWVDHGLEEVKVLEINKADAK